MSDHQDNVLQEDDPILLVHPPGTECVLGGQVRAKILAVTISGEFDVQYLCAWFIEGQRLEQLLSSCEIEVMTPAHRDVAKMVIGFHAKPKEGVA